MRERLWKSKTSVFVPGFLPKRLRDVCALPESEPLWRAGRGFAIRDLPWTVEKLRVIPPFEFENWAVIALGGIPNKVQVGDLGVHGRTTELTPSARSPNLRHGQKDFRHEGFRGR